MQFAIPEKIFMLKGKLPEGLVLGLAAIITCYKGEKHTNKTVFNSINSPEILQLVKTL